MCYEPLLFPQFSDVSHCSKKILTCVLRLWYYGFIVVLQYHCGITVPIVVYITVQEQTYEGYCILVLLIVAFACFQALGGCTDFLQADFDDPNVSWDILLQFMQVAIGSFLNGRNVSEFHCNVSFYSHLHFCWIGHFLLLLHAANLNVRNYYIHM